MKPNFYAIGAIGHALQAGVTQVPLFLKRGWLGVFVIFASAIAFADSLHALSEQLEDFDVPTELFVFGDEVVDFFAQNDDFEYEMSEEERDAIGTLFLTMAGYLLGLVLMVPGFVDVYRAAARIEPKPGYIPGFGAAEGSLILTVILVYIAEIVFSVVALIPTGAIIALAVTQEIWPLIALAGAGFIVSIIWFQTRISLVPAVAAIEERIAFGDGFALTGGRFWKLLGTLILFGIILVFINLVVSLVGLASDFLAAFGASLLISSLFGLYVMIAATALNGRIAGELLGFDGTPEEEEPLAEEPEIEPELDDIDPGDGRDAADVAEAEVVDEVQPRSAFGQPMRRKGDHVPRRLH